MKSTESAPISAPGASTDQSEVITYDPSLEMTASPDSLAPQAPRGRFRKDIQGLRALAVLLVIGNHAGISGFKGGFIGVDVFFVISGYVITQLLLREAPKGMRSGLADFYSRRIMRIVPAATAALVGTLAVGGIVLGANLDPNLPGDVRWASLFAANFRFIATGSNYFVPGIHPSPIIQFWSLGVEEQFYFFFPALVFGIWRFVPTKNRLKVLSITLGIAIITSAWWSIQISPSQSVTAYYSPFTRFWELGVGCLLATLTTGPLRRSFISEWVAVVLGIGLLGTALVILGPTSVFPGSLAWLPVGATALFIWAGAGGTNTPITRFLSIRPLTYIGDISYSLYLVHYGWLEIPKQLFPPLTGTSWVLAELVGTAITAVLLHHLIENTVRHSRRLASDRVAIVLVLCVCIAASWTQAILTQRILHLS